MLTVIGDILPLAVVIASNPIVVIVTVLLLFSPGGGGSSLGYLVGWMGGLVIATVALVMLTDVLSGDSGGSRPIVGVLGILLGAGMLYLGWQKWRGRPTMGEPADLPAWMASVDRMSPARAIGLGFMLSALNPKNLMMVWSASLLIGSAGLGTGQVAIVTAVFIGIAASSVCLPVIAHRVAPERVAEPLSTIREWLVQNNAIVMAVLLFVMGVMVIGKGIGKF